jgi:hypothetical protein
MLGFQITSWIRFFVFGLLAGAFLSFVEFQPIALLGRIDAVASLLGLVSTVLYARSYEQRAWRRFVIRTRRWRGVLGSAMPVPGGHLSIQRTHAHRPGI